MNNVFEYTVAVFLEYPLAFLQTLNAISAEKNSTIVFPLPIEILGAFMDEGSAAATDGLRQRKQGKDLQDLME